ncbi:transposase, IS605 OrfB family, central region [Lentzea albidocapillata]|uniref:Transposase, IS605 OrfB family, central region n=2 Tax=Lentzea albidocapillata TaxID=40571 RepID=A0A1W2DZ13_9PSEU|nr:transposase, IS605 OrfB family, central region [Lentzea albidocapillata]
MVHRQFGHRARLALDTARRTMLDEQAHAARALWNLLHDWWTMQARDRRTLAAADAAIRQARKDIDWLTVLPAQAAQAVLKTYFQSWMNCWEGRAAAPTFKSRLRSSLVVDVPQGRDLKVIRVHRRWGMVNIPKAGRVRFRWTRELPVGKHTDDNNRVTGARLVKDALGWHIAFRVTATTPEPVAHTGPEVGIDVGVTVPLALSDGNHQDHGRPARAEHNRSDRDKWLTTPEKRRLLRLEQRAAHRKTHRMPGERTSKRLRVTYDQIRRLRATATRRVVDWQHHTTTTLATHYGTIVVEQLQIPNMVKSARGTIEQPGTHVAQKSGLNRAISQEAWGRTITMLAYKTARNGGQLIKVPAPGTSQRCSVCAIITPAAAKTKPRSSAKTRTADGRATPTTTPPATSCTYTGPAMRWSRLPEGQSSGAHTASSRPPQGRAESPTFTYGESFKPASAPSQEVFRSSCRRP